MQRPKVGEVSKWETIFVAEMLHDSRGLHGGIVYIQRGLPFQDYYKVISRMGKAPTKKKNRSQHITLKMSIGTQELKNLINDKLLTKNTVKDQTSSNQF